MKKYVIIIFVALLTMACNENTEQDLANLEQDLEELEQNLEELGDVDKLLDGIELDHLEIKMEKMVAAESSMDTEMIEEVRVIESKGAKSVLVDMTIVASYFKLSSGTKHLMVAGLKHDMPDWTPNINYTVSHRKGHLIVNQSESNTIDLSKHGESIWNVRLNELIPMELNIFFGAGKAEMDFRNMNLKRLNMKMGVGVSELNFGGMWKQNADIYLKGGIGQICITLPEKVGARVTIKQAMGSVDAEGLIQQNKNVYVNQAYQKSDVTLEFTVETGLGVVYLRTEK